MQEIERLRAQLSTLGEITVRAIFGGHGLYHRNAIFGIVYRGRLYLKVDERSKLAFEAMGMQPFRPDDRQDFQAYYEVPASVLNNAEALLGWAREAILVGIADLGPASPAETGPMRPSAVSPKTPVAQLQNLGPMSARWLHEAGVVTLADLRKVGVVKAYLKIKSRQPAATLSLLYALEGALTDVPVSRIAPETRKRLKDEAGE